MSNHRHFKQRQARRLDYMMQAELAAEKLRQEQLEAEARLQNQLDTLDSIATPNDSVEVGTK
jgi:hypothetical protein